MEMPPLDTERLVIRPIEARDLPAVLTVLEVTGPEAEAATERYVRHGGLNAAVLSELGQPPLGDRAVVLRSTGELIGLAGLVPAFGPFDQLRLLDTEADASERPPAMKRIEIGLYYHVAHQLRGRGYATEAARALIEFAFGPMRLGRIVATTERDNLASQAVMRRLGMQMHENALDEPEWFQLAGILENPNR
ncbi:MAG: GNAT family N-acetyltransferase [Candidatus Limnocylindria bacterium]